MSAFVVSINLVLSVLCAIVCYRRCLPSDGFRELFPWFLRGLLWEAVVRLQWLSRMRRPAPHAIYCGVVSFVVRDTYANLF